MRRRVQKLINQINSSLTFEEKVEVAKSVFLFIEQTTFEDYENELREKFFNDHVYHLLDSICLHVLKLKLDEEEVATSYFHILYELFHALMVSIENKNLH